MCSKSAASGVLRAAPGIALAHVYLHGSLGDTDCTYAAVQFDNTDSQPQIAVRPLPVTHPRVRTPAGLLSGTADLLVFCEALYKYNHTVCPPLLFFTLTYFAPYNYFDMTHVKSFEVYT